MFASGVCGQQALTRGPAAIIETISATNFDLHVSLKFWQLSHAYCDHQQTVCSVMSYLCPPTASIATINVTNSMETRCGGTADILNSIRFRLPTPKMSGAMNMSQWQNTDPAGRARYHQNALQVCARETDNRLYT